MVIELWNRSGWESPLRSRSPATPPALPRPPLAHVTSATSTWLLNSPRHGDSTPSWAAVPVPDHPFHGEIFPIFVRIEHFRKDFWVVSTDLCYYNFLLLNGIRGFIFICSKRVIVPNVLCICCWLLMPAFLCSPWKELGNTRSVFKWKACPAQLM